MRRIINIAIDGPSGSGKSTLAKAIAKEYGIIYIDTGALYRTVGLFALRHGVSSEDTEGVVSLLPQIKIELRQEEGGGAVYLDGKKAGDEIRTPVCSVYASNVSKIPAVRAFLLDLQRDIARNYSCVMDGRDIGTVIMPSADVKLFLSADNSDRAKRRYEELSSKGVEITLQEVLNDMLWRDSNDKNRDVAPAVAAKDAFLIDNSGLTQEQTFLKAKEIIDKMVKF